MYDCVNGHLSLQMSEIQIWRLNIQSICQHSAYTDLILLIKTCQHNLMMINFVSLLVF